MRALAERLRQASEDSAGAFATLRDRWFEALLGDEREEIPTSYHMGYMRRLSPLESTYTKERSVEVCLATLSHLGFDLANEKSIKLDLDDRPQKSPRLRHRLGRPNVVHLITRAQGGLHDYQAFLHEAGHALHYAGVDPQLPYTFRNLSRDHALTEIYSFVLEAISREPAWHSEHFGLSDEEAQRNAEATVFLEALLYRRYAAKLASSSTSGIGSRRTGHFRRVLREAQRGNGGPVSIRRVPRRHGRGLLLGGLPAGVDSLGAAPRAPGARGRADWWRLRRPASACGPCSPRERDPRARRSQRGSASIRSTRSRSSPSSVPDVAFDRFHRYDELTEILQGWAEERPEVFHLESIGSRSKGATSGWRR